MFQLINWLDVIMFNKIKNVFGFTKLSNVELAKISGASARNIVAMFITTECQRPHIAGAKLLVLLADKS